MTLSMATPEPGRPANRARPYTLTAGRTRPHIDLSIEATVEALTNGESAWGAADARSVIVGLCNDRLSIAEISAYAGIPIGVARVLVADLVESGHLRVYATLADTATVADQRHLIERTLDGLRAI
jgi:hypothetical protein